MDKRAIWKFTLVTDVKNDFWANMPVDAKVLSAGWQGDFVVWAIVDPDAKTETRWFHVAGTGHPLPIPLRHGGQLLNRVEINMPSGPLIFHVFDTGSWRAGHEAFPDFTERADVPRG